MTLPSHNHILILCRNCNQEKVVETPTLHARSAYCTPECEHEYLLKYWKGVWVKRKTSPKAIEYANAAKARYKARKLAKAQEGMPE